MSTAALASARRRRTTNDPAASSQNASNKSSQQESPNSAKQALPPPQSLTPLQILQLHDNKLKDLETLLIELNSEEYITNVVDEKITELMQSKLATFSNELDKVKVPDHNFNSFETKLQMLETTIQTNLSIQNVRLDEFKNGIQDNFNTFKENTIKMIELLNAKETNVSRTNVSMPSESTMNVEKLELLTKEVNELKLLVIKNQTLALETCTSLINMKDDIKLNNEKMAQTIDKVRASSMNNMCCSKEQCDPAQMFLQSFMRTKLFGGTNKMNMGTNMDTNMDYEYESEGEGEGEGENQGSDNTKKLHIDLTNEKIVLDEEEIISDDDKIVMDTDELITDESQLKEILESVSMEEINLNSTSLKQDLLDEIKNISLDTNDSNL
jgi:hypothetical protein